jgi:hypothetical protein
MAPTWIVFELLPTKLVHYPLPVYPTIALMAGAGLVATADYGGRGLRWGGAAMFLFSAAGGVLLVAACAWLPGYAETRRITNFAAALPTAAPVALAVLIAAGLFLRARGPALAGIAGIATALLMMFVARGILLPQARGVFVSQQASDALWAQNMHPRQHMDGPRLISVGYDEPSFVFLTRTDTLLARGNDAPRAAKPGTIMIVESRERTTLERSLAVRGWAFAPSGPAVRGLDYSNGKRIVLQPGRVVAVSAGVNGIGEEGDDDLSASDETAPE